jgi:CHASE2 domain-containing sensor protein
MLRRPRPNRSAAFGAVVVTLVTFAIGLTVGLTGALNGLERETLKARFDIRGAQRPDDIAVVGIDARTFGELDRQWPFPRSLHAQVIRRLHAAGAREIVYDVQFTEPSEPRQDLALYRAITDVGGAVLATSESDGHGHTRVLGGDANLRRAHARAGASDLHNDDAGTVTQFAHDVGGLDTLAVATAERAGAPALRPAAFGSDGAWIDYRGPPGTIPTLSFSDVLRGRFDPAAVRGRVVVVGAAAPTLRDVHSTPVGGDKLMAGVEVQANAIWTALHGLPLRAAGLPLRLAIILLMSAFAPLLLLRVPALAVALAVPVAGGIYVVVAQLAFDAGLILYVVPALTALILGMVATIAWSHVAETRARRAAEVDNELLEAAVRERTRELHETQLEIAHRLAAAVESRDPETGMHIERIGCSCERLALASGMSGEAAELIRHASALHDVGKVGIPDDILRKPGKLDPDEWETMKTHTTIGAGLLHGSASPLVQVGAEIALTHHERWDGTGYPAGLAGEEIPIEGRICAICDVFDALLSPRPYKEPWPLDEVLVEMQGLRGTHFDPRLLDIFLELAPGLHEEYFAGAAEPALA